MPATATTAQPAAPSACRYCGSQQFESVVDLGKTPLCESFLTESELGRPELFYPLHAFVCKDCHLVQLNEFVSGQEIFGGEYAYFSSWSESWLQHCRQFAFRMKTELRLSKQSHVVELASNDGYLLHNFVELDIPCLGVEPAKNVAEVAIARGIPTRIEYFCMRVATTMKKADLVVANNVLAHVPELNDFVAGIKTILAPHGVVTVEVPHLLRLIQNCQFDTIYHEHFCYFSLDLLQRLFASHQLKIYRVEELATHGGSLRVFGQHVAGCQPDDGSVRSVLEAEEQFGLGNLEVFRQFGQDVQRTKRDLLHQLVGLKAQGKSIVGYGAPGKANTLLNYCGIGRDFLDYVVDRSPYKQGRYLPGTHIPILPVERLERTRPDCIVILPWNLKQEILSQLDYAKDWGARFILPIPEPVII